MTSKVKRNLWGEIIIAVALTGVTIGWAIPVLLLYYIYKKDFRFIGALLYTFGMFFIGFIVFAIFVDSDELLAITLFGLVCIIWGWTFNHIYGSGKKGEKPKHRQTDRINDL